MVVAVAFCRDGWKCFFSIQVWFLSHLTVETVGEWGWHRSVHVFTPKGQDQMRMILQQYWYGTGMMIMTSKVYTCSHSRIRCDRWYWKYSAFYWQFWDATHTEQCVQGIQFNNMDLEGGQFGDSQFFWKCPQCSQLHMSTCHNSFESVHNVHNSTCPHVGAVTNPSEWWRGVHTRLLLPGWPEASNGRSCHLHQLNYEMQPCQSKK